MTPHFRNLLAGLLSLLCFSAYAQDYQYSVFVDADLNDGVGCDVVLPGLGETISGVEFRLTAHVGNQPRVVTDVTREQCTGGTFGAPVSLGTSHAVGFDNGLAAGDVVEWSDFRSNITDNPGQARLYFTATSNMAGGEDVLLTTDGGPNGGPIIIGLFFIIPALGGFGLLLMALLLVLTGVRHKKLLRGLVSSGLLLTAFAVWAANHMDDGMIGD